MRTLALIFSAVVTLTGACTSEETNQVARPSPSQTATAEETTSIQIYAAVIRQLITRDHTFGGGPPPFKHIYVVNGAIKDAGDPLGGDLFGPAPKPFPSIVMTGVKEQLRDLPPLRFILDGNRARRGKQGMGGVKNDGVIISLGPIERRNGRVHVPNALWCGGLCGQWLTYVLHQTEGKWKITGTTGPTAIS